MSRWLLGSGLVILGLPALGYLSATRSADPEGTGMRFGLALVLLGPVALLCLAGGLGLLIYARTVRRLPLARLDWAMAILAVATLAAALLRFA